MSRIESRVITATIPGRAEEVRAWYLDLTNLRRVHPLIVAVRQVGTALEADGTAITDYLVTDRMVVAGLRIRFTYRVRMSAPPDGPVATLARQAPRIRLVGQVTFTPTGDATAIRETLTIHAPWPLRRFVAAEAEQAHTRMFAAMAEMFTTTGPAQPES